MDLDQILAAIDGRPVAKNLTGREFLNLTQPTMGSDGRRRASLHLFDAISYWTGNDARTFQARLDAIDADVIDLRINSPGGAVFEGVAIYNMLLAHPAEIIVHVDGLAASIASVIALAGAEVRIAENGMFMIHNPSALVMGGAEDLRQTADTLDAIKEAILNTYESRTVLGREKLGELMTAETWFTADEAVRDGFATSKVQALRAAAHWNPADFPDLPESAKAFALGEEEPPADDPGPDAVGTVEEVAAARDKALALMERYGI